MEVRVVAEVGTDLYRAVTVLLAAIEAQAEPGMSDMRVTQIRVHGEKVPGSDDEATVVTYSYTI